MKERKKNSKSPKKTTSKAKPSSKLTALEKAKRRKRLRFLLLFLLTILVLGTFAFLGWRAFIMLGRGNPRFKLKHIEVTSSGWWNKRNKLMASKLGLKVGRDNLFCKDLKGLRDLVKKLPCVETANVCRLLPDTLKIDIVERLPRAFIGSSHAKLVVDEGGMIMERKYCLKVQKNLPVLMGISQFGKLYPGKIFHECYSALQLIMFVKRDFPDFRIAAISLHNPNKLYAVIYYRGYKFYKVYLPRVKIKDFLSILQLAVKKAIKNKDKHTTIDLTYNGRVVFR